MEKQFKKTTKDSNKNILAQEQRRFLFNTKLSGLSLIRIRIYETMSLYVIRGSQRPPRKLLAKNKQIRHPENTFVID